MALQISVENHFFLIPEADDPCEFWTSYFVKLKKELGQDNAKMIWLITWKTNGATTCTTSPRFNAWLLSNDLDVTTMATRSIADLSEIGGNLFGLGKNLTKLLSIGVPVVLTLLLVGVLMVLRNSTKSATLQDAISLLPGGNVLKQLKK